MHLDNCESLPAEICVVLGDLFSVLVLGVPFHKPEDVFTTQQGPINPMPRSPPSNPRRFELGWDLQQIGPARSPHFLGPIPALCSPVRSIFIIYSATATYASAKMPGAMNGTTFPRVLQTTNVQASWPLHPLSWNSTM
jgi:hypothetical protein